MRAQRGKRGRFTPLILAGGGLLALLGAWSLPSREGVMSGLNPAGGTIVAVGLAFLAIWGLRKLSPHLNQTLPAGTSSIKLKAVCPVSQGMALVLVEVEGEKFLLSSSREKLELIARLTSDEGHSSVTQKECSFQ